MLLTIPATYPEQTVIKYYQTVQSPLFVGLDSAVLLKSTEKYLDTVKPSGIILLGNNIENYEQTKKLISDIKKYAQKKGISIEISIDEEGGLVSRLKNLNGYPRDFTGISDYNSKTASKQADYMKQIGINLNLAPVADIAYKNSVMTTRSAGETSVKVSEVISSYIDILHANNIESSVKHFPGLGRTTSDTHFSQTTVGINYRQWLVTDSIPFKTAVDNGTDYVMTGHVIYNQIDSLPASISPKWTEILRNELHFEGRIITDDLKMVGVGEYGNTYLCNNKKKVSGKDKYAVIIKKALDAGTNNPLLILNQQDTINATKDWILIEKECI
ncbi:MAG: Beta-glucosidase-like protein glycosyl hydrolase [candidate division WS6 bacterium GW2011_GWF2_39_15]|uniref:beta-N-acetylhexosaminidase n=1 Tax=candidate division WS6 bacterium GW2011_GWF2_39_15 TaxID=1619100 RepID=A0A0G0MQG4_9BACT|nr:MAG: Beta-glucosidase-like protein glycosyl hydrolase [candidate division WS6 bacterium GW2011_GWF2_39_15]